jgi:transposase
LALVFAFPRLHLSDHVRIHVAILRPPFIRICALSRPCGQRGFPLRRDRDSRLENGSQPWTETSSTTRAWALLAPFLPPIRGRACRPATDNRRVLEGIFWIARTGSPWRDLPERFGKWNTVWRRFTRWRDAGMFDAILEALVASGAGDLTIQMIDSIVIRVHQHSDGAQKGGFI